MAKDYTKVPYPSTESSKGCCNRELLKTFLLFFDSIIILTGIGLIGVGLYLLISRDHFTAILANEVFFMSNYIILGTGILVLFVAILGLISVCKTWSALLHAFCWLLGIIFVIEAVGGVLALVFLGRVQELLVGRVRNIMIYKYDMATNPEITSAVDDLQRTFKCCGASSYHDWENSRFVKSSKNGTTKNLTPESCCITPSAYCARNSHPSNIYHIGCVSYFARLLSKNLILIAIVALVVSAVQLLGVIIGCSLFRRLNLDERRKSHRLSSNRRGRDT